MLKLLHRHVLRETLVATALAMGLFVFVLLTGNVVRDVAELIAAGQLGAWTVARLIGLLIPYVAAYALPLGILTGTLIAFGRLSSQREITAMKAAGVGVYQIAAPVLFLAVVGVAAAVVVNFRLAPQARVAYDDLLTETVRDNPVKFIEEKRFIHAFPGYVIYLGERDGKALKDFWIWELDDKKRVTTFLRAERGRVRYREGDAALDLILNDGTAEKREPADPEAAMETPGRTLFFEKLAIGLPLDEILGDRRGSKRLKEMTFAELMRERREAMAQEAAGGGIGERRMEVQFKIQENFAMAFSVLSLALLGAPLAIRVGRKETYANLALALALAMGYYFLVVAVGWLENRPKLRPDLLVWVPNLVFQTAGVVLLVRANRH